MPSPLEIVLTWAAIVGGLWLAANIAWAVFVVGGIGVYMLFEKPEPGGE